MARSRKCRICGYRFRDNEDICPECFTARDDDISCDQFSGEDHSHSAGYSTTEPSDVYEEFHEKSFVDEQRQEELEDPIPSATYDRSSVPPPGYGYQKDPGRPNYSNQHYAARNTGDVLRQIREGVKQGRYGPQSSFGQQPNYTPNRNAGMQQRPFGPNGQVPQVKKSSVGAVIAIFVLITFLLPVIIFITVMGNDSYKTSKKSSTTTKRPLQDFSYDMSIRDISIPDFSELDVREAYKRVSNKYKVSMKFIKKFLPFNKNEVSELFTDEQWGTVRDGDVSELRMITFELYLEDLSGGKKSYTLVPEKTYIACDEVGGELICNSYLFGYEPKKKGYGNCTFFMPADCWRTRAFITVKSDDGTEESVELLIRDLNYNVVDDSYGTEELDSALDLKLPDDGSIDTKEYEDFIKGDIDSFDLDSYFAQFD